MTKTAPLALLLLSSAAAAQPAPPAWRAVAGEGFTLEVTDADQDRAAELAKVLAGGRGEVEAFFGRPFPRSVAVKLFPDRALLTAFWREEWKAPDFKPECWMVATGTARNLTVLSPRVWKKEACDHDPGDAVAVSRLLTHELVHVFHGQSSPSPDFDGLEGIDWFVEGLATYASGQLDAQRLSRARDAVAAGKGPARLADVWKGPNRYGFAGSLIAYVDGRWGRKTLVEMLRGTAQAGLLATLGVDEGQLLEGWRASLANAPAR